MRNLGLLIFLMLSAFSLGNNEKGIGGNEKVLINSNKGDVVQIRERWLMLLTGLSDNQDYYKKEEFHKIVSQLDKSAEKVLSSLNREANRKYLFSDFKNIKNGAEILNSFENIKVLARSYITPGTKNYKDGEIKNIIIESLEWLNRNAYKKGMAESGNWWQWEIGIPKIINEIGIIAYDYIPKELLENLMDASRYFQPYAIYSGASPAAKYSSSPNKRVSTGGNRMDTAIISFGRGVLSSNVHEIEEGIKATGDIGEIVTEKDGFHEDGSFIQHDNVAYNGTYASVLFNGLGNLLYITKGTEYSPSDKRLNNLYEIITEGFKYLLINGGVNDSVSGRSISRDESNDLERGRALVGALAMISEGVASPYKENIQKLIKRVIIENNSYDVVDRTGNLIIRNILKNIIENENLEIDREKGIKIFHSMDRAVQIGGRGGKVVVAMHSSRIANYETMNGENLKGWYTGDGVTYIYGNSSDAFTDYWPTVDSLHLPGTTESKNSRGPGSGERRLPVTVSKKSWAGGASTGESAMIGMDFLSWNSKTEAKKSWFMLGEEVVALGSGITSTDDEVDTTIDNRIIQDINKKVVTVNNKVVKDLKKIRGTEGTYVNFTDKETGENIGYKMLSSASMDVEIRSERGSWRGIGGKSNEVKEKKFMKLYVSHGRNPKDSRYSYIILPMFTPEEVKNYDTGKIDIVRQDSEAHAIEEKERKILGVNFWKEKEVKVRDIKAFSPVSVIRHITGSEVILAVSDPTQLSKYETVIELDGIYELVSENAVLIRDFKKERTILKVNLINKGKTVIIKLRRM